MPAKGGLVGNLKECKMQRVFEEPNVQAMKERAGRLVERDQATAKTVADLIRKAQAPNPENWPFKHHVSGLRVSWPTATPEWVPSGWSDGDNLRLAH